MKKVNENPIDQYFREMLKSPDLKYNQQDWKGLEEMLPRENRKKGLAWWLPASVAAAVLLLFASLWLLNKPVPENSALVKVKKETKAGSFEDKTSSNEKITPTLKNTDPVFSKNGNTTAGVSPQSAGTGKKQLTNKTAPSRLSGIPTENIKSKTFADQQTENTAASFWPMQFNALEVLKTNDDDPLFNRTPIKTIALTPTEPASLSKPEPPGLAENPNSRLSLALSLSPDINSVNHFSTNSFGGSMGLGVSYRISRNLSVSTALAYSKKIYSALPSEYKMPWASSAVKYAKSVDADCRVLAIPLNLNFTFSQSAKRSLFASAGLSSYFMMKENYTIVSKASPPGYPPYPNYNYDYKNENTHLLSVLNLSVGISKPLNKQTSLVIEPYTRLPLTGIGQGKVNLQSVGVNFQLQYNFKKKARPNPVSLNAAQ